MKTLYLLRHAKSDHDGRTPDELRPINARGKSACALIGDYLKHQGINPDAILSSSATRTKQTINLITRRAGIMQEPQFCKELYLATPGEMMKAIAKQAPKDAESLLIVAHNPGVQQLAALLSHGKGDGQALEQLRIKYPTATLAILTLHIDDWDAIQPDCGTLLALVTPKSLES